MYVGRIVAVGKTTHAFVAYRVSSRSFPNRVARIVGVGVAIEPLDPADIKRNPYISYNCIRVCTHAVVASNGLHTDAICSQLDRGVDPEAALRTVLAEMGYEKDEHNTPRIAGVVTEAAGFIGIVRTDGVETQSFALQTNSCRVICTYLMDHLDGAAHPLAAATAEEAARYVVDGGLFREFEHPVCSAAWMGELAVYNPSG